MSNLQRYSAFFIFLIVLHVFTMRRHVVSSIQIAVSPTVTTFRSRINARIFPNHWFMTRKWHPPTLSIPHCHHHHHRTFHSSVQLYGRQRTPKNDFDETSSAFETDTTNKSKNSGVSSSNKTMKKENFPSKICVVCQRPFTWRKKWERSWDEITTCSKKCNSERRSGR